MSDPLDKMRQFLADNVASLELAKLGMERNRRKEIRPRIADPTGTRREAEKAELAWRAASAGLRLTRRPL